MDLKISTVCEKNEKMLGVFFYSHFTCRT